MEVDVKKKGKVISCADKALLCAETTACENNYRHYRDKPQKWYSGNVPLSDKFEKFISTRILPIIKLSGYRQQAKKRIAVKIIADLWMTELRGKVLKDSRNNSKNTLRISVFDSIESAGLLHKCLGSEISQSATLYKCSRKLTQLMKSYDQEMPLLDYKLHKNSERKRPTDHAYVVLHNGKKDLITGEKLSPTERRKPIAFTNLNPVILRQFEKSEKLIEQINKNNLCHTWLVPSLPTEKQQLFFVPNPCHKETHSIIPLRCTRISSWSDISVQSLPKERRKKMLIDSEPVTELDYSGFDIRRYYHFRGIDPDRYQDIYKADQILPFYEKTTDLHKQWIRKFVKMATNIMFNVLSKEEAIRAIRYNFSKNRHKQYLFKIFKKENLLTNNHDNCIDWHSFVDRILDAHSEIEDDFFKSFSFGKYFVPQGNVMMTLGSAIILDILLDFVKANKPAVGIHDAIVCKTKDNNFAYKSMIRNYKKWCAGFRPVIKKEF